MATDRERLEYLRALKAAQSETDPRARLNALRELKGMSGADGPQQVNIEPGHLYEFELPFEVSSRQIKTALGLMATFDDDREAKLIKKNYPEIKFMVDQEGNLIADGTAYGGNIGYINAPGLSFRDLTDIGFQVAAFTPAGRAAGAGGMLGRMARVGAASGATQAGLDVGTQALGGTDRVSIANIDPYEVGVAAAGGAVAEPLANIAGRVVKGLATAWKKSRPRAVIRARRQAAEAFGIDPREITDDMVNDWFAAAEDAVDTKTPRNVRADRTGALMDQRDLGIEYTAGQRTGDLEQLRTEDNMRHGAFGPRAEGTMRNFESGRQADSINDAVSAMHENIAGGQPNLQRVTDAGEVIRDGIKARASALDRQVGEAYENVGDAFLSGENLLSVVRKVRRPSLEIDFVKTPQMAATREILKDMRALEKQLRTASGPIKPIHLKKLEQYRRRISSHIDGIDANNRTDLRQATILKREYDAAIDEAIDGALFSGDPGAMDALMKARGLRREYAQKFQRNDVRGKGVKIKDTVGETVARMVAADPNAEDVVNYFFNSSDIAKASGTHLVKHIKTQLGATSPEFQALREAAFMKLTGEYMKSGAVSGQKFTNHLNKALTRTPAMMETLYTKEEIAQLKRLAGAIKRAQPDKLNASGTSYSLMAQIRQLIERSAAVMGFATGGVSGALTASAAQEGVKHLSNRAGGRVAQRVTQAQMRPLRRLSVVPAAGAVSGSAAAQDEEMKRRLLEEMGLSVNPIVVSQ